MAFDQATTEGISIFARLPDGFTRFNARIVYVNAGGGAGDVVWQITALDVVTGDTIASSGASASTTSTAGAADMVVTTAGVGFTLAGEQVALRVYRLGADGADTLSNDAGMIWLLLEQF